jgi:hypothetical protein
MLRKLKISCQLLIFIFFKISSYYIPSDDYKNTTLQKFAFGYCYGGFLSGRTDIFKVVNSRNPNLWLWNGDATYLDNLFNNYFSYKNKFDTILVGKKFNETKNDPCNYNNLI